MVKKQAKTTTEMRRITSWRFVRQSVYDDDDNIRQIEFSLYLRRIE